VTRAEAQAETAADSILQPGQLVGERYRVEHLLGQGGMAAVWAGTNERTGKHIALKVILRSLAKTSLAQGLFNSEVLAASLVNHPNVVTVFDVIEHEGMACIVMELLEGEPLGNYIARKGFLSVNEATMLLLPAMRGVAAANAQGVIHRDLKPQNIFICMEPDGRIVTTKVLDFGISVMVEQGMDPSTGTTAAMGTPAYMSPEHILGVAKIDARADVYGFGVLLYEALTGETPFPGEPSPALFDRVLHKAPAPLAVTRPDLPPGLVRIIEKAMAKDREERFPDVNLMVLAIEDELMPPTPAPRLLTPFAGVPIHAGREPASGSHPAVVEKVLSKELSGPQQETRFLFEFPLQPERQADAAPIETSDEGKAGPAEVASPPAPAAQPRRIDLQTLISRTRSFGLGARSALRGGRRLAGAGLAVVLGFFAVWMLMRGAHHTQIVRAPTVHALPAAPVVQPAEPAVVLTSAVDPVAALDPAITPATPPAASSSATSEHAQPARHARARPGSVTPHHSQAAVHAPDSARPSARRAAAKSAEPRAGRLSRDDF
jgi:eukaryotic-like serine/threonine-protein kinase